MSLVAPADAALELARRVEIAAVLDDLAAAGVSPILIKGAPLAYSIYEHPTARPRFDTDLVVRRERVDTVRHVLAARGYDATVYCDGELVFGQFEMQKLDAFGVTHAFDVHWKISTQTLFADLLSYEELADGAVPVHALGPHARMAGYVHALLLACVHPAMHHRNERNPTWTNDVHLLAAQLNEREWQRFADLAVSKEVAAIASHAIENARDAFGTAIPQPVADVLRDASGRREPSAQYLDASRSWRHEFAANLRHLPTWRGRLHLLREVLLPSVTYMSGSYGVGRRTARALLPALYVHRLLKGSWKLVQGRK